MQVMMAVAKTPKSGFSESGDSVELVERPLGGVSAIIADGQNHGKAAKRLSQLVVAKAMQLIADGVRDGAVARGVHDYLYAVRGGKVSTELTILSADSNTQTLVIARNSQVPVLLRHADGRIDRLAEPVEPIGVREILKPIITEVPLAPGMTVLAFTDGVLSAGRRRERQWPVERLEELLRGVPPDQVAALADAVLAEAIALDGGHPADDMSVVTVGIVPAKDERIRRMGLVMQL